MKFFARIFSAIGQSRQMQAERFMRDHAHLLAHYEIRIAADSMNAAEVAKTEPAGSMTLAEFKLAA